MAIELHEAGAELSEDVIAALDQHLRGSVILHGDPRYDDARKVWNGMIDKYPAMIAQCYGTADVAASLRFAADHGLRVAVRGNGHNVAGNAVNDGGIVIDLSPMKGIQIDPVRRTARVQPGANWGDVDRETQLYGLVTPGGQVSTTGVAGFTLVGGMGFLRRKWGLACDNLIGAEVVTADGKVLNVSELQHEDLFWAIRGGGGNFGIVTSLEFQIHPLGPEIYGAITIYPMDEAPSVVQKWRDFINHAPDEVTCDVLLWGMPPLPIAPPEMHWAPVVIVVVMYAGPVSTGERVMQPLRELGTPLADLSGPQSYVSMQQTFDPLLPNGLNYYWKSLYAEQLRDEVVAAIVDLANDRPSPQTLLALRGLGGAMGRVPESMTAYGNRNAGFNLSVDATWIDANLSSIAIEWTRSAWSRMRELTKGGVYLNFAGFGEEADALARAGYGSNYARLKEIKQRYDPSNLFHGNINIAP